MIRKMSLVAAALCAVLFVIACPAQAQLNHNRILQDTQQKAQDANNQQQQTQQQVNTANSAVNQATGTIIAIAGSALVIDQVNTVNGKPVAARVTYFLQKSTQYASNFKPKTNAKVKVIFQQAVDGKRMVNSIGP